jgi:hypothetical protein
MSVDRLADAAIERYEMGRAENEFVTVDSDGKGRHRGS